MVNGHTTSTNTTFAFATIFLLAAMAMIAVSFSTNNWIQVYVNRDELERLGVDETKLQDDPNFWSSERGLFRTCYDESAAFVDKYENLVDGRCLKEQGYEVPRRRQETIAYGDDYEIRIHLLRSHFGAFVLAIVFFFVSCCTAIGGCWNSNIVLVRTTGVLVFVGMFFCAGGMALFHGYNYMELNLLVDMPNTPAWLDRQAQANLDYAQLVRNSATQYGFSYILGWLALAMSALSGILYLVVAYKYVMADEAKYGRKKRQHHRRFHQHEPEFYDNQAYAPYNDDYYRTMSVVYPPYEPSAMDYGYAGSYRY